MKKFFLYLFIPLNLLLIPAVLITHTQPVYATLGGSASGSAEPQTEDPYTVNARAPFFPDTEKYEGIADYIGDFYTYAVWLVTIISVIMIIWGAYMIITSSGNPESVKHGRDMITSALVSLGLLLMATAILSIISPQLVKNPWFKLDTIPDYGQDGVPSTTTSTNGPIESGNGTTPTTTTGTTPTGTAPNNPNQQPAPNLPNPPGNQPPPD